MVESRKDENKSTGAASPVVSDRRARRKLKRGEEVVRAEDPTTDLDDDYEDEDDYDDEESAGEATNRGITAPKQTKTRSREEALRDREREAQSRVESAPVVGGLVTYLRGVAAEIRKVTWPTREEAQRLTILVLAVTVTAAIVLGAIDLFYGKWMQEGIKNTGTFILIAIPTVAIFGGLSWFYVIREQE